MAGSGGDADGRHENATRAPHERAAAEFAAGLAVADVPEHVRDHAGLVVADTVGAILGGASDPAVAALVADWAAASERGDATVLGTCAQASRHRVAMLNGTAGTVLELDEGHRFAGGHPAIHVLPGLLAEAETDYGNSQEFLAAFVAGYEVAVRTARMVGPLDGYHPHGVWGGVGCAAAVARYRGYDADRTLAAMRLAAGYAQHTRFDAATEGATGRNANAGMANLTGMVAADQAGAGFTGLADGVARHLEPASAEGVERAHLDGTLGERWEIERGYFKRHAACRYTHAALDAVDALRERHEIDPGAVEDVLVETYPAAAALTATRPRNPLQAKFSLPFAVATALRGDTGKAGFGAEALVEEAFALAERVEGRVASDVAARVPDERGARVTVTLDGERLTHEVRAARGGERDPFTEAELREKFEELAGPVVGDHRVAELWRAARDPVAPRVVCALARG